LWLNDDSFDKLLYDIFNKMTIFTKIFVED
jgi:hypothetical protein